MRPTKEQRVWDTLKASPRPLRVTELSRMLEEWMPRDTVSRTLWRLSIAKRIDWIGPTHARRYWAIGHRPTDKRGQHGHRWTTESATAGAMTRWHGIPFSVCTNAETGAESGAGENFPQRSVGNGTPPPIPTLADLIARR